MAGKRVKAKNMGGNIAGSFLSGVKSFITGNPGAKAGARVGGGLGDALIGGALTGKRKKGAKRLKAK